MRATILLYRRANNMSGARQYNYMGAHVNILVHASIILSTRASIYRRACLYIGARVNNNIEARPYVDVRAPIYTCAPI